MVDSEAAQDAQVQQETTNDAQEDLVHHGGEGLIPSLCRIKKAQSVFSPLN